MASILVVDPNQTFRKMMEQLLRQQGHEVSGVTDAETAGKAMKEVNFDLAIIELVLPGEMSGTEFLEWLRDFPAPGDPARIALCSLPSFADQEGYLRAELALDGFVVKPFKPSALPQAVKVALEARSARPRGSRPRLGTPPLGTNPPAAGSTSTSASAAPQDPTLESKDLEPLEEPKPKAIFDVPTDDFVNAGGGAISLDTLAPEPQTVERRAVPRFPVRLPVVVHDGKAPFRARSENLARGGAFLNSDRRFAPGTQLRVRLELPVEGSGFNEVAARVIHGEPSRQMEGFGLSFLEMSEETARRLDLFLEQLRQPAARPFLVVASLSLASEVEKVAQSFRDEEIRVRLIKPSDDVSEVALGEPPDLILLDLAVPLVTGAVNNLKSTRATGRIQVGLIDRTGQPQVALLAAAAGADRFFVLPEDLPRLVNFSVDALAASRRRSVRVRFQRPVTLLLGEREVTADGVDLSETGLQLKVGDTPGLGVEMEVVIPLSDGLPPLVLPARVAWNGEAPSGETGMRLGLLFEPQDPDRARIREEVRKALAVSYYVRWLASAPKPKPSPPRPS